MFFANNASKMGSFFHDSASTYRVFVRNASPARGFGGTAFRYSYCLEYDAGLDIIPPEDVNQLLAHEMIHNWPMIGKNSDSDETQKIYDWYNEGMQKYSSWAQLTYQGIADYYSIIMPHDYGLLDEVTFIQQVNDFLAGYYTHPLINWSNKELADAGWKNMYAITLPYLRGFIYLLKVSGQLGRVKFNEIVNVLLEQKTKGPICTEQDWLDQLQIELGQQAEDEFSDMADGKIIVPKGALKAYNLVREDKEIFDLGMNNSSMDLRKVTGLHLDSRAAKAGIEEGDAIISNTPVFLCQAHHLQLMAMKILRNGTRLEIKYWPRGWEKVEAWQFEKSPMHSRIP